MVVFILRCLPKQRNKEASKSVPDTYSELSKLDFSNTTRPGYPPPIEHTPPESFISIENAIWGDLDHSTDPRAVDRNRKNPSYPLWAS